MRSMFVNAAFSRYDLGRQVLGGGVGLPSLQLGARLGQQSAYAVQDFVKDIEGIADKDTRDRLKAQYQDCQTKEGTSEIVCYAGLAAAIYAAGTKKGTTPTVAPLPIVQPSSPFPVVPVLLATLGAGALIYFLVSRGKKK
jgi:hypothetical protein